MHLIRSILVVVLFATAPGGPGSVLGDDGSDSPDRVRVTTEETGRVPAAEPAREASPPRGGSWLARLSRPFHESWWNAVRVTSDWWRTYRSDLELEGMIGTPEVVEPETWTSLEAAGRDLARFARAWRYQSLRDHRAVAIQAPDPHEPTVGEGFDEAAVEQLIEGSILTVRRHLTVQDEIPDLMAALASRNGRLRRQLGADGFVQRQMLQGWSIPLALVGLSALRNEGALQLDVGLQRRPETGQSLDWRTQVSGLGLALEPRAQTGLLWDLPSLRVEMLTGAQVSFEGVRDPRLDVRLQQKQVPRFLSAGPLAYARWVSGISVPLDEGSSNSGASRVRIENGLSWSRATSPGAHVDVGIHVSHELEGARRAALGAGWTSSDALTRVFSDIAVDVPGPGTTPAPSTSGVYIGVDHRY